MQSHLGRQAERRSQSQKIRTRNSHKGPEAQEEGQAQRRGLGHHLLQVWIERAVPQRCCREVTQQHLSCC